MSDTFYKHLETLTGKAFFLSPLETEKIFIVLFQVFPFIGINIDWEKVEKKIFFKSPQINQIKFYIEQLVGRITLNEDVYILWDDAPVNGIKTTLDIAFKNLGIFTSLGTRTWVFNLSHGYVIEWHRTGAKVIGIASPKNISKGLLWKNFLDNLKSSSTFLPSNDLLKLLKNKFGFGKSIVEWKIINRQTTLSTSDFNLIESTLENLLKEPLSNTVYVLWENYNFALRTTLESLVLTWNSFIQTHPKWIISKSWQYVIEINTDKILVGLPPQRTPVLKKHYSLE